MKKKKLFIAIIIIIIIIITFVTTDYYRAKKNKTPFYAIKIGQYKDGGSKEYIGLGYKFIKCNTLNGNKSSHIGFYNMNINVCKESTDSSLENQPVLLDEYKIIKQESKGTADYLFNLKTSYSDSSNVDTILKVLQLDFYGNYSYSFKKVNDSYRLIINYNRIEGWGNILDQEKELQKKSGVILTLIEDANEVEWVNNEDNERKLITITELNKKYGNLKDISSLEQLNKLLVKLDYYKETEPITITMTKLTSEGAEIEIKNNSKDKFNYGELFIVEYKDNDKWIPVKGMPQYFNMFGYTLLENENITKKCSWNTSLSKGEYRLVKDFTKIISSTEESTTYGEEHIIYVEFTI